MMKYYRIQDFSSEHIAHLKIGAQLDKRDLFPVLADTRTWSRPANVPKPVS